MTSELRNDVIVIGAGAAGLATALWLTDRNVTVLSKAPLGECAATGWAQGGIAAALGPDDDTSLHAADTRAVAAGIADAAVAQRITRAAPATIQWLAHIGARFDVDAEGRFKLGREAGHGRRRIVHACGDSTGREVLRALVAAVRQASHITVLENVTAEALLTEDSRVVGVAARHGAETITLTANAVVLATGGIGQLYRRTTNPATACGEGIALAAHAGAHLADLEFVQFHPTALDVGRDPMPLATEALRGDGATLVNDQGIRFMKAVHPDAELAPRDVVARAIWRQRQTGHKTYLDCRSAIGVSFESRFPTVYGFCVEAGIDPMRQLIPVAPATHYHMGGVATDAEGRTSLAGLWAAGEVACTGLHGGNRLASNSVLEALVMAERVAVDIATQPRRPMAVPARKIEAIRTPPESAQIARLRGMMDDRVGLVRDEAGLLEALSMIAAMERTDASRPLSVAKLIAVSALQRRESRGGHFRSDYPEPSPNWAHRSFITLAEADDFVAERLDLMPQRHRVQA